MDSIPIIIDDKTCGSVSFTRQGAYMLCRGQARYSGNMLRLWLYGRGEPGYLGVLQQSGEVRRKFSLAEFGLLPHPLEYCGARARQSAAPPEADVLWYDMGDGTLLCDRDGKRYRAFPAEGVKLPRGAQVFLREIEGRQYVVFPG